MFTKHSELLMASDALGITRGATQTLVGTFLGILIFAGLVDAAADGQLATMYTPVGLVGSALRLTMIGAVLALLVPYATTFAAVGWALGAALAAFDGLETGQWEYAAALLAHVLGAATVLRVSNRVSRASGGSTWPFASRLRIAWIYPALMAATAI